jgi:hypothetical protein
MSKQDILDSFINKYEGLPKQGSAEWLKNRTYRIGGSEIATVLNKNPYQKVKALLQTHVGLSSFKGFYATYWGTVFESMVRNHVNTILNCNIVETGAIPHSVYEQFAYSPDGISVVNVQTLKKLLDSNDKEICDTIVNNDESIILFEFKCPHSRVPTGNVPIYYADQPRLGMKVIDICEMAVFIEAVYKVCALDDIGYNNNYNFNYHKDKFTLTNNPISCGVVIFYYNDVDKDEISNSIDKDIQKNLTQLLKDIKRFSYNKTKYLDIGRINNSYVVNKVLEMRATNPDILMMDESIVATYNCENNSQAMNSYNEMMITYGINQKIATRIEELESQNKIILGIMPYKLFNLIINPIYKDEGFLSPELIKNVELIVDTIKQCMHKTNDEKNSIIEQFVKQKLF